jgi:hypothetical protein
VVELEHAATLFLDTISLDARMNALATDVQAGLTLAVRPAGLPAVAENRVVTVYVESAAGGDADLRELVPFFSGGTLGWIRLVDGIGSAGKSQNWKKIKQN